MGLTPIFSHHLQSHLWENKRLTYFLTTITNSCSKYYSRTSARVFLLPVLASFQDSTYARSRPALFLILTDNSFPGPIIDPAEFPARIHAHRDGKQTLSPEGILISMLLVTWAASFGVDERGVEDTGSDPAYVSPNSLITIAGNCCSKLIQQTLRTCTAIAG
jgi:hypothetical protein